MPIKCVVLDASPLICLFKSGLADLLPALFQDVVVPEAVIKEVMAEGKSDFAAQAVITRSWVHSMANIALILSWLRGIWGKEKAPSSLSL